MKRFLSIAALCLMATACGDASDDDSKRTTVTPTTDNGLDPTTMVLESPPTDGKLPNDLLPPA
jgi:hypothetical protein